MAVDFGKTLMSSTLACDRSIKKKKVGLFAPEHKQLQEPYVEILSMLRPLVLSSNKTDGVIRLTTGGLIDFWRLNDNELAGRGREYDTILIDEAAFTKNGQMLDIWSKSIKPTMATRPNAEVFVFSTPNGIRDDNFFYAICEGEPEKHGFKIHHAPSDVNPLVSREWLEEERLKNHPLIFQQEYLAEFVDFRGQAFFGLDNMLLNGAPYGMPLKCDQVFAVVDTAVKDGSEHDGTAVVFCALSLYPTPELFILDYDLIQIEGALLENWLPGVFARCEELAAQCGARQGSIGAFIEDKQTGQVLLQQGFHRRWPVHAIDGALTAMGKDQRAINITSQVYQRKVHLTGPAHDKTVTYKGSTRNHLITQVCGYRIGQKDGADDIFDCFCYAVAIALGQVDGYA